MEKQAFIEVVRRSRSWIHRMEEAASRIHQEVNQMYDDTLPYGFHLRLTAACVSRYGYEVARTEADVLILYAAAYLHDTIEDARMSYNDVRRFLGAFNDVDFPADVDARRSFEEQVPEIVYALTNEKGRNRAERASEAYYAGIRSTRFASFVKMCDRLANIRYSTMFVFANRMLDVYREEYPAFIRAIHLCCGYKRRSLFKFFGGPLDFRKDRKRPAGGGHDGGGIR